jgi:transcriptional regulator with XRE-family HTH domain
LCVKSQPFLLGKYPADYVVNKRKSLKLTTRLGRNIAERRKELALTQERLSELVNVDTETISRFERGVTAPSLATLETLAKQLEMTISELLDEVSPQPIEEAQRISAMMTRLKAKERGFLMALVKLYCDQHG